MIVQLSEEEASQKFDALYTSAKEILLRHNPCNYQNGECLTKVKCCRGCRHLTRNGCGTQSLSCKLWLCSYAEWKFRKCAAELNELIEEARKYGFLGYRETKEEMLARIARGLRHPSESRDWY